MEKHSAGMPGGEDAPESDHSASHRADTIELEPIPMPEDWQTDDTETR